MMGPSLETGAVFDAALSGELLRDRDCVSAMAVTLGCDEKRAGAHPEPAPIRQKRFYDFGVRTNVRTEEKQIEKLRYIHRNPVKRGLMDCPEQ
jgi:hypothetical protein